MKDKGFTLIELLMIVGIVGILMAIAIPQYQAYTVRTKLAEALANLGAAKTAVAEYFQSQGTMPPDASAAGLATTVGSKYLSAVTYFQNGTTSATLSAVITGGLGGNTAGGQTLLLVGSGSPTTIVWNCHAGTIPAKYLPSDCRS